MTAEQKTRLRELAKLHDNCGATAVALAKEMLSIAGPGVFGVLKHSSEELNDPEWMQKKIEKTILIEEGLAKLTENEKIALQLIRE